jgi:hypothetical protein
MLFFWFLKYYKGWSALFPAPEHTERLVDEIKRKKEKQRVHTLG